MGLSLQERDKKVIWHPYTSQKYAPVPIPVIKAKGAWLFDDKGNRYLDAISSWWVTIHGHAHPYIAKKIYEQAQILEQVIFAGFTHEPAVHLAERILHILPGNFSKIFYSDNGSTATEVAIKMAIQYWWNQGDKKRTRILALSHSYHGDTFGAMSISERGLFTLAFHDRLFDVIFAETPEEGKPVSVTKEILDECACVIYEPLLQGAGGMKMYSPRALNEFIATCRSHGIICIADEVMTGFGRTGKMFASSYCDLQPDIICLSKGITGGTMALGVTACTKNIHDAFVADEKSKTFFHGHSFTANPLACAAALASLDLFETENTLEHVQHIGNMHRHFAERLTGLKQVENIRIRGTIIAFEVKDKVEGYSSGVREKITEKALKQGVYLRPLGNTVYIMPPYCISEEELEKVYCVLLDCI
ncbi:MAG TPA: adenosylmethionine--8-amino-7-oxononanoate transaminase [Flavitalea sp.]|nr:adenosylmethionine--8-amino-7-oxononanoate transaminase [Flavitalea sp.]